MTVCQFRYRRFLGRCTAPPVYFFERRRFKQVVVGYSKRQFWHPSIDTLATILDQLEGNAITEIDEEAFDRRKMWIAKNLPFNCQRSLEDVLVASQEYFLYLESIFNEALIPITQYAFETTERLIEFSEKLGMGLKPTVGDAGHCIHLFETCSRLLIAVSGY